MTQAPAEPTRATLVGIFRCPLFRGPLVKSLYDIVLALFGKMFIYIRLNKDMQAYNEEAPNRGA